MLVSQSKITCTTRFLIFIGLEVMPSILASFLSVSDVVDEFLRGYVVVKNELKTVLLQDVSNVISQRTSTDHMLSSET